MANRSLEALEPSDSGVQEKTHLLKEWNRQYRPVQQVRRRGRDVLQVPEHTNPLTPCEVQLWRRLIEQTGAAARKERERKNSR